MCFDVRSEGAAVSTESQLEGPCSRLRRRNGGRMKADATNPRQKDIVDEALERYRAKKHETMKHGANQGITINGKLRVEAHVGKKVSGPTMMNESQLKYHQKRLRTLARMQRVADKLLGRKVT